MENGERVMEDLLTKHKGTPLHIKEDIWLKVSDATQASTDASLSTFLTVPLGK